MKYDEDEKGVYIFNLKDMKIFWIRRYLEFYPVVDIIKFLLIFVFFHKKYKFLKKLHLEKKYIKLYNLL